MVWYFNGEQPYLECLFSTLFAVAYYGLLRICEVCKVPSSNHVIMGESVHFARNKETFWVMLYTSKTHGTNVEPQKVTIVSNKCKHSGKYVARHFCPFQLISRYIAMMGAIWYPQEAFFIYRDHTLVHGETARSLLRALIKRLGLNDKLYDFHSLRIGRTTDLIKFNYSLEEVKRMGRWKSNIIYKYIRL